MGDKKMGRRKRGMRRSRRKMGRLRWRKWMMWRKNSSQPPMTGANRAAI
jgi:hypothetical protein